MDEDELSAAISDSTKSSGSSSNFVVQASSPYRRLHDVKILTADGKAQLIDERSTAYAWSSAKKWRVLIVIFLVECSMNMNPTIYPNAVSGMMREFGISWQEAAGAMSGYLFAYAIGCELWSPWSEEIGRKPIVQASLFLLNILQVPAATATGIVPMALARVLGGLSSAGGSVMLGIIADLYKPDDHQYAVAFIAFASVFGYVIGPIVGGSIEHFLPWRWVFWVQLIIGLVVQALHLFLVPETRSAVILDREANRCRTAGIDSNLYGPNEIRGPLSQHLTWKKLCEIWFRSFKMLLNEPIVTCLSLLGGFADGLLFTFLESYERVFKQWKFNAAEIGLAFIPLVIGYLIGCVIFISFFRRDRQIIRNKKALVPERRLVGLLFTAPLLTAGLIGFAVCSQGPEHGYHWTLPLLFSILIGIADYAIYLAPVDYMVATYGGEYSASATAGHGFACDMLAGAAASYSLPFYKHFHHHTLLWPTVILAGISVVVIIPVYCFYYFGKTIRSHSKFCKRAAEEARREAEQRVMVVDNAGLAQVLPSDAVAPIVVGQ